MKKIALVVSTLTNGGAERTVSLWADELHARGYDVSVVLFHRSDSEYETDRAIPIYALAKDRAAYKAMNPFEKYFALRRMLREIDPDYIISFLPSPQAWVMLASVGLKAKRIETLRNNPRFGKVHANPFYRAIWRLCFLTGDKIIVQTKDQLRFFSKREREKSVIVPNQLSGQFANHSPEKAIRRPSSFMAVGKFHPQKNFPMMIDAFARACQDRDDMHLRIFGTGDASSIAEMDALVKASGMADRIELMGWSPNLAEEYRKSDAFLLTSNYEGMPNALMEAMASELICISTDCETGPHDLIESGKSGILSPVGNIAAFAEAIECVCDMPVDDLAVMAHAARSRVLEYCSPRTSIDVLCKCFEG